MSSGAIPQNITPSIYTIRFELSNGTFFDMEVIRSLYPAAADRVYELTRFGYWINNSIFRNVYYPEDESNREFGVVQWGINSSPIINTIWNMPIEDYHNVTLKNIYGTVAMAADLGSDNLATNMTTQIYVNTTNNTSLDDYGFVPFAMIKENGIDVVRNTYSGYGDIPAYDQANITRYGEKYIDYHYNRVTRINNAYFVIQ